MDIDILYLGKSLGRFGKKMVLLRKLKNGFFFAKNWVKMGSWVLKIGTG